jgi:hypothetical protein
MTVTGIFPNLMITARGSVPRFLPSRVMVSPIKAVSGEKFEIAGLLPDGPVGMGVSLSEHAAKISKLATNETRK